MQTKKLTERKLRKIYGFKQDSKGIIERLQNEEAGWSSHIQNTKKTIISEAKDKNRNICMVLGSGWCIDVPLRELSEMFEKIILVDLIHPEYILHQAKKNKKIKIVSFDISGVLNKLYEYKKNRIKNVKLTDFLRFNGVAGLFEEIMPDYVISVNLLSQLAYFPSHFIEKHKLATFDESVKIKNKIEKTHLESLPKNKSVLITDFYEFEYNFKGDRIKEQKRLTIGLPGEKIKEEWIWNFDMSGNYHTGNPVKFKVAALQV